MSRLECPFRAGETVIYQPTEHGRGWSLQTDLAALQPGKAYRIARIIEGTYVVPEGFEGATPGGMCWTEFAYTTKDERQGEGRV